MIVLGIETSCDETSAALIEINPKTNSLSLLSNIISSSLTLHAATGGIIPEIAAREQLKYILPVLREALLPLDTNATKAMGKVDAIAVTYGPGLIGSLLVGVETARTLASLYTKPLIPVNHMMGHIYANWLTSDKQLMTKDQQQISFPAIALVVSGGHTDLILMRDHNDYSVIGGTRDDAAGEAFDKIGRLLNLPYPAGATISRLAQNGIPKSFKFPRPMWDSKDYDFSFSGLKTAVRNQVEVLKPLTDEIKADICASVEQAIVDVLVKKTLLAVTEYQAKSLLLSGGVAANNKLRSTFALEIRNLKFEIGLFVPQKDLCTDNAAMIAAAGYFMNKPIPWQELIANPELYY